MSMLRKDLLNYFDQLLSPSQFEDYSPNGLQIEGTETISKIAFAVSATKDSIDEALKWGAQALVVHHGVFWKHQGSRTITGAWGERVKTAIKNDLNIIGYHLPLDAHAEIGNAKALADELQLTDLSPFALYKRQALGLKGKFPTPIKASELKARLQQVLKHDIIHASPNDEQMISTLGIVTGGANNEWARALEDGLDAFLTGEISEYNWHDAKEAGIHYFAGGHHATEKFGIQALMKRLKLEKKVEVAFFDSANPA
jgi:dinuclear metal center YbgI/SA1388 family protein